MKLVKRNVSSGSSLNVHINCNLCLGAEFPLGSRWNCVVLFTDRCRKGVFDTAPAKEFSRFVFFDRSCLMLGWIKFWCSMDSNIYLDWDVCEYIGHIKLRTLALVFGWSFNVSAPSIDYIEFLPEFRFASIYFRGSTSSIFLY